MWLYRFDSFYFFSLENLLRSVFLAKMYLIIWPLLFVVRVLIWNPGPQFHHHVPLLCHFYDFMWRPYCTVIMIRNSWELLVIRGCLDWSQNMELWTWTLSCIWINVMHLERLTEKVKIIYYTMVSSELLCFFLFFCRGHAAAMILEVWPTWLTSCRSERVEIF